MDFVGIDKFSLLDYDEMISIVLFSPTCNFRCPYCHNINTVVDAVTYIPFEDIMAYLNDRKNVIDAVVISGGEPTLMSDLKEKIIRIKKLGYKIKLDTNGSNPKVLKDLLDENLLDYVAMDIKSSFDKYDIVAGQKVNLPLVLESIKLLKNAGIDYEFRTTLIEEIHDFEDIKKIGELIKGAKKYYLQKFINRDDLINKNLHPVDEMKANEYKEYLSKFIGKVELRGY